MIHRETTFHCTDVGWNKELAPVQYTGCGTNIFTGLNAAQWAYGVVVSHPLRMRKALGSIPSGSICSCTALVGVFFLRLTEQHKDIRTSTRLVPVTRRTSKDSPSEASSSPNTPGEEDWSHSNWPAFVPRASVCQGRSGRLGCSGRSGVFPRRTLRQRILRCFSSKHLIRFEAFYPKQPKDRRTSTHLWVYSGLPPP